MGPDKTDWYSVIYHNDNGDKFDLDDCRSYNGPRGAEQNAKEHALKSMERAIPQSSINLHREYVYTIVSDRTREDVRRITVTHTISSDTEIFS